MLTNFKLPSSVISLQINELETVLNVDLQKQDKQKILRKKYPSKTSLVKITRIGRDFYYGSFRVGITEIDLIESEDFEDKQKIVVELRLLLKDFNLKYIDKSPWSVAESCIILILLYDHAIRDALMQSSTVNTIYFYNQICIRFGLKRNIEAYRKKQKFILYRIVTLKSLQLTTKDFQSILDYVKQNIIDDPQKLNNFKINKHQNELIGFDSKDCGIIHWNSLQEVTQINIEKPLMQKNIMTHVTQEDKSNKESKQLKETKSSREERHLQNISSKYHVPLIEVRQIWQHCHMDMAKLIDDLSDLVSLDEEQEAAIIDLT